MPALDPADYLEVLDVTARFGHVIDDREWDRIDEVFSDDGTFDMSQLGLWTGTGLDVLRERLSQSPAGVSHHASNLIVTGHDGDKANVISKFVLVWEDGHVT